ncbi:MAG: hypothetical protein AAF844_01155 [Pseudomonadota bacterium]
MMRKIDCALALFLVAGGSAAFPVLAAEPVPFRPDEAILACHARGLSAIAAEEGVGARAEGRFETERMPKHMWHVSGKFLAQFDGADRVVGVDCDVSSEGVEVFTMEIGR